MGLRKSLCNSPNFRFHVCYMGKINRIHQTSHQVIWHCPSHFKRIFSKVACGYPTIRISDGERRLRIHAHLCLSHSHNPSFSVMAGLHLCEGCRIHRELQNHLEALGSLLTLQAFLPCWWWPGFVYMGASQLGRWSRSQSCNWWRRNGWPGSRHSLRSCM